MEEWRDIQGFPGYQVSNKGRVRTHGKVTSSKRCERRKWKDRIMKQKVNHRDNYSRVELWCENGKHKTVLVHRLVAEAFIPHTEPDNPSNRGMAMTVNHINRNRQDNRVENLEWLTLADNTRAAFRLGVSAQKPCSLKAENGLVVYFISQACAGRFLGRSSSYVSDAIKKCSGNVEDKYGNRYMAFADEG